MINYSKQNYRQVSSFYAPYSKQLILALAVYFFSVDSLFATYFREISQITHERLAHSQDLIVTPDSRYFFVITGWSENTIQAYQLLDSKQNQSLIKLVGITNKDCSGNKLFNLGALFTLSNDRIYTLSEKYQNNSHGCLLSVYDFGVEAGLSPRKELFIESPGLPPFQKHITGTNNQIFFSCQSLLIAVDIGQKGEHFQKKDTITLESSNFYPVSLAYSNRLNLLYLLFSPSATAGNRTVGRAYTYQDSKLKNPKDVLISSDTVSLNGTSKRVVLISQKFFLVCLSLFDISGSLTIITANALKSLQPHFGDALVLMLYSTDFILSQDSRRLFYTSTDRIRRIGALSINAKGKVEEIPSDIIGSNITYQKLALNKDGCHLLAMARSRSKNGTLTLYRINDPVIGCNAAYHLSLLEEVSIATVAIVSIFTIALIAACSFRRYWIQGSRKGYVPVGNPDY